MLELLSELRVEVVRHYVIIIIHSLSPCLTAQIIVAVVIITLLVIVHA